MPPTFVLSHILVKTDSATPTPTDTLDEMNTPRPTINTDLPEGSSQLQTYRRRQIVKRMPALTAKEKARMSYIVCKFRKKQMALLGEDDYCSDPDPFRPTYVFYCFQGALED